LEPLNFQSCWGCCLYNASFFLPLQFKDLINDLALECLLKPKFLSGVLTELADIP